MGLIQECLEMYNTSVEEKKLTEANLKAKENEYNKKAKALEDEYMESAESDLKLIDNIEKFQESLKVRAFPANLKDLWATLQDMAGDKLKGKTLKLVTDCSFSYDGRPYNMREMKTLMRTEGKKYSIYLSIESSANGVTEPKQVWFQSAMPLDLDADIGDGRKFGDIVSLTSGLEQGTIYPRTRIEIPTKVYSDITFQFPLYSFRSTCEGPQCVCKAIEVLMDKTNSSSQR